MWQLIAAAGNLLTHLACFLAGALCVFAAGVVLVEHEKQIKKKVAAQRKN